MERAGAWGDAGGMVCADRPINGAHSDAVGEVTRLPEALCGRLTSLHSPAALPL